RELVQRGVPGLLLVLELFPPGLRKLGERRSHSLPPSDRPAPQAGRGNSPNPFQRLIDRQRQAGVRRILGPRLDDGVLPAVGSCRSIGQNICPRTRELVGGPSVL